MGTPISRNRHIQGKSLIDREGRSRPSAYKSLPQCEPESRKANKVRDAPLKTMERYGEFRDLS